jgi:hypothetical protein
MGMSTSAFVVVRIDAIDAEGRDQAAQNAIDWLTGERVLAPLADSLWPASEFALGSWGPGAEWTKAAVAPLPEGWESRTGEEVDITTDRDVVSAMGNSEDFTCSQCSTAIGDDLLGELIEEWMEDGEPDTTCVSCGWAARLGDWSSQRPPALVGGPAITFFRWPEFDPAFVARLVTQVGGRCRTFWTYI